MSTLVESIHSRKSKRYANAAEWLQALGDIPLNRIVMDPLPGTATEADLLRLVEGERRLCELIDGTLVEKPVGYWEAMIALRLGALLMLFADKFDLGAVSGADTTLRMKSGRIRLPDIAFVARERLPRTREAIPTLSPDLAVEILSESNTAAEMALKLEEYFQSGTRLVWIVDAKARTVAVYHAPGGPTCVLTESGELSGETILPGLSIQVAEIFRNVPR